MKPLAGLKVLDLSQRLPGPLAGMLLADLGAQVYKLEDIKRPDAFLDTATARIDDCFVEWYKLLNTAKFIERIDFNSLEFEQKIQIHLKDADIILLGLSEKIAAIINPAVAQLPRAIAVIELAASQDFRSMHDLNALAQSGLLQLHVSGSNESIVAPPFLPMAGICFGQQVALTALALHRQAQQMGKPLISKVFLYDELLRVCRPFWTDALREQNRTKFLHNGKYPCYCLYRNKDGDWVAVAAVEEKFWLEFIHLFGMKLNESDRFSTDSQIFQTVANSIQARTTAELTELLMNKDICVSLIRAGA